MESITFALLAGACLAAVSVIWIFLAGSLSLTSGRIVLSAWYAAYCTLVGLAGFYCFVQGKARQSLGKLTIFLSAAALLSALMLIWGVSSLSGPVASGAFVLSALMFASGHASLMLSRLRRSESPLLANLTWSAVSLVSGLALFFSGLVVISPGNLPTIIWRLIGIAIVLAVLSTILAVLLRLVKGAIAAESEN